MIRFIFATESYPFTCELARVVPAPAAGCALVTRDVHLSLDAADLARFGQVRAVERFDLASVEAAVRSLDAAPGACLVSHDDFFYEVLAEVGRRCGLRIYTRESILPFLDKDAMKRRLRGSGVRLPGYRVFDAARHAAGGDAYLRETAAAIGYPLFAKPLQGAGAENCRLLADEAVFADWAAQRAPGLAYEIDEYIAGTLYHCDSVLRGGMPVFTQVCRYSHPCAEFAQGRMVGSWTLHPDDAAREPMLRFTAQVFAALGASHPVPDGVTHMEMFHTPQREIVFLEVQFRPPGANVRKAYAEHLGTNLEEHHYRLQLGLPCDVPAASGRHAAWMYFPTADGVVASVRALPALESELLECSWGVRPGDRTRAPASILDARGRGVVALSLVLANADHAALCRDIEALERHVPFALAPHQEEIPCA